MFKSLDKYRISKGSNSYAEVPVKDIISFNNNEYRCTEHVIATNVYGVDRCDYCALENTDICSKMRCTNARSDHSWVYFVQVNKPVKLGVIPLAKKICIK